MADKTEAKHQGLRLSLPGAPSTFHTVPDVPGYYHPDFASPVGGPGDLDLEAAKAIDADESLHLELVTMTAAEDKAARKRIAEFARTARRDLASTAREGRGRERTIARQELVQTSPGSTDDPTEG